MVTDVSKTWAEVREYQGDILWHFPMTKLFCNYYGSETFDQRVYNIYVPPTTLLSLVRPFPLLPLHPMQASKSSPWHIHNLKKLV